jgi:hypothetical protein
MGPDAICLPGATSQNRSVSSSLADARTLPSGLKQTDATMSDGPAGCHASRGAIIQRLF